jgi:hypothetical protein
VDGKSMYDQEFSPYQGTCSLDTLRNSLTFWYCFTSLHFTSLHSLHFKEKWSHVKFKQSIT